MTPEHECLFTKLKSSLTSDTDLTIPNPKHPLLITVDTSLSGLGAVLFPLIEDNKKKVIAYNSTILNPQEQKRSTFGSEPLSILHALQIHEILIIGSPNPIHHITDHKPLLHIVSEREAL